MGAFTAVAASSPLSAPSTASAISMATPSCDMCLVQVNIQNALPKFKNITFTHLSDSVIGIIL